MESENEKKEYIKTGASDRNKIIIASAVAFLAIVAIGAWLLFFGPGR